MKYNENMFNLSKKLIEKLPENMDQLIEEKFINKLFELFNEQFNNIDFNNINEYYSSTPYIMTMDLESNLVYTMTIDCGELYDLTDMIIRSKMVDYFSDEYAINIVELPIKNNDSKFRITWFFKDYFDKLKDGEPKQKKLN